MTQVHTERAAAPIALPVKNQEAVKIQRFSLRRILLIAGPVVLIAGGGLYYAFSGRYVTTDNAYIKSRVLSITSTVAGQVVQVPATDNELVKKGDVLVQIDPEPYRLKLAAADADLARVVQDTEALRAQVRSRQQDLAEANADAAYFQREYDRQKPLVNSGAVSRTLYDKAERDLLSAKAKSAGLEQQIRANLAKLGGNIDTPVEHLPDYLSALAARDTAAYNLAHATIVAAADGKVGAVTVRTGEYVSPGEALFPEISTNNSWIEANVRETDLTYLHDGLPATYTVDAYPGRTFHARLKSFSPATGSELSVLPAENATGNWVKIVQRLPLNLTPELRDDDPPMRAGLSVDIEIDTGAYRHLPGFLQRLFGTGGDAAAK
jgi:membrane fusion protein (multidrug efflux system)